MTVTTLAIAALMAATGAWAQNRPDVNWIHTNFISAVTEMAVSPDGQALAVAGDVRIDLYRMSDGKCLRTLIGRGSACHTVAWSPDGATLASTGYNGQLWLYRASDGALLAQTKTNLTGSSCLSVAFSPDGQVVATATPANTTLDFWRASDLRLVNRVAAVGARCVAFAPGGSSVAVGFGDKRVRVLDATSGAVLATMSGHTAQVNDVAFSPDGSMVVSGSDDKTGRIWNAATGGSLAVLTGPTYPVDDVAFSPDGSKVVTANWDGNLIVSTAPGGSHVRTVASGSAALAVCFTPDGNGLLGSKRTDRAAEWRLADGGEVREFTNAPPRLATVSIDPTGTRVAGCGSDLRVYALADGALERNYGYVPYPQGDVGWSPDGSLIYAVGGTGVTVWETATGAYSGSLAMAETSANRNAISRDGSRAAVAASDGTVAAYDVITSTRLWGHPSAGTYPPHAMTFSPNAAQLADVADLGDGGLLEVWDVATGASALSLAIPSSHGRPTALRFSPTGTEVAVGTSAGKVVLVTVATGDMRPLSPAGGTYVNSVAFTPDGSLLLVGYSGPMTQVVRVTDGVVLAAYGEEMGRGMLDADLNAAGTLWCYSRLDACIVAANMPDLGGTASLSMPNKAGVVGASVELSATLMDGAAPLAGRTVAFWRDRAWWEYGFLGTAVTDAAGVARLNYVLPGPVGNQWFFAAYAGGNGYRYVGATGIVAVGKPTSRLFLPDRAGALGATIGIRGYLATNEGSRIPGQTVTFAIDATSVGSAATDVGGRATLWYALPPTLAVGVHTLSGAYAGDGTYPAASASATLTVTQGGTFMWVLSRTAARNTSTYLRALLRGTIQLNPIGGVPVSFTLAGTALGSALTESSGRVSLLYTVPGGMPAADHVLECAFAGDASWLPSTGLGVLTVTP